MRPVLKKLLPFILLGLLLLTGCKAQPGVSPLNSPFQPTATPAPTASALPRPAPGTGVVGGILKIEHTDQPMQGVELYLGQHIGATPDTPMYSMDPSSAPHAITDEQGHFVFKDVPPGRYAIVVWNPFNSFLARDPATGLELIVEVKPDQVYEVGTLFEPLP